MQNIRNCGEYNIIQDEYELKQIWKLNFNLKVNKIILDFAYLKILVDSNVCSSNKQNEICE